MFSFIFNAVLFLLLLVPSMCLFAQDYNETIGIRVGGGLLLSNHSGNPNQTSRIIDCGELTSGSGTGPVFGLGLEVPLNRWMGLGLDIYYADRSGVFTRNNTYPMRDATTGQETNMVAEHRLKGTLQFLEFSPMLILPVFGTIQQRSLGISIGPRVMLPLTTRVEQREVVTSPSNAFFEENGLRTQQRVISEGTLISRSSILFAMSVSAESELPISSRVSVMPRLAYDLVLSSVVTDASWGIGGLRAEVGLRYSLGTTTEQQPVVPVVPAPAPIVETPIAYAQPRIFLETYGFAGEVVTGNQLRAEPPIVNAVFFDSASARVPLSYRRSIDGSNAGTDAVLAHAWVLPRIAAIVRENSEARIVLEGSTCGSPWENEGAALAMRRADAVKALLVEMGVAPESVTTRGTIQPRVVSNNEYSAGREENRRVEITLLNAPLQRWVNTEQFAEARGVINVRARYQGGDPAAQPKSMVVSIDGTDTLVSASFIQGGISLALPLKPDQIKLPVHVTASAGGVFGQRDTVLDVTKLPRRRITLQTDQFDAVLRFDYNSSDLSDDVKGLLKQLAEQLPNGATVIIESSADALGTEVRNKILTDQRGKNTEQYLRSVANKQINITTATRQEKFSDQTPQGRFLNRSIRLQVQLAR